MDNLYEKSKKRGGWVKEITITLKSLETRDFLHTYTLVKNLLVQ